MVRFSVLCMIEALPYKNIKFGMACMDESLPSYLNLAILF